VDTNDEVIFVSPLLSAEIDSFSGNQVESRLLPEGRKQRDYLLSTKLGSFFFGV